MSDRPIGMIVPMQDPTPFSPFAPANWREGLRRLREAGFDGVELAITNPDLLEAARVAEALDTEGLRLLSITTGQAAALEGLSLSSEDTDVRRRAVDRIVSHMAFAEGFGAVVIVGSLRGADGDLGLLSESLRACAVAHPAVTIALEPLNRYESRLLNCVTEALEFLDAVDAPNIGLLFDTFHANIEETSSVESIRRIGDRLVHVHVADSNRWVPGHGHVDFGAVERALDEVAYRGAVVLEPLPRPNAESLLAGAAVLHGSWATLGTRKDGA